jgi:hypothetical protein
MKKCRVKNIRQDLRLLAGATSTMFKQLGT